jgi:hypothetical protein
MDRATHDHPELTLGLPIDIRAIYGQLVTQRCSRRDIGDPAPGLLSVVVWRHVVAQPLLTLFGVPTGIRITLVRRRLPVAVVTGGAGQAQISRLES